MDASSIEGMGVSLVISDPWDFVTENGSGPFEGHIMRVGDNPWIENESALLIKLSQPLKFQTSSHGYLIASPRLSRNRMADIANDAPIACNFIPLPVERVNSSNPFDLSSVEAGEGIIGTLQKF